MRIGRSFLQSFFLLTALAACGGQQGAGGAGGAAGPAGQAGDLDISAEGQVVARVGKGGVSLDEYIERVGTPKHVVLVHAHDVWHRGYNSALIGQIPRPWGFWNHRRPSIHIASKYLRNGVDLEVQWLANVAVASA